MHTVMAEQLKGVEDFICWYPKFSDIFGYLDALEGYTLKLYAEKGPGAGEIVEIGSFMGKSTCWLAAGLKQRDAVEKVWAVDHFRGSPEHQSNQSCECKELIDVGTTFQQFRHNLKSVNLEDFVVPLKGDSESVVKNWTEPIRLLFIDGDHSYEAVEKDFKLWSRFVVPGGIIIFHDVGKWLGPTQFYQQLMQANHQYQAVMSVSSVRVIARLFG